MRSPAPSKTTALVAALALTLSLGASWPLSAGAIPVHPHGVRAPAGLPGDPTTFEDDGDRGDFESHAHPGTTEAGDRPHQHYDTEDFGGWDDETDPWSAFGAWIDESFFLDNSGAFDGVAADGTSTWPRVPHGFIDEFSADNTADDKTMAGKEDRIPDFFFKGAGWEEGADKNKARVRDAFSLWSALEANKSPVSGLDLITGLEFEETDVEGNAEIILLWGGTNALGLTTWAHVGSTANTEGDVTVQFNSTVDWFFGADPALTPDDEFHFFSTAIHEAGHVVGLNEQTDVDDVMIKARDKGKNDPANGKGPAFNAIDVDSRRGAFALYSIPVPEPASSVLLAIGLGALVARRRGAR